MGMITAHSGCDNTEDNSLEFIRYALASGADCLEVDVRYGANGVLSLSHDEAGAESVALMEAFTLLKEKPEKKINCDLKEKGLEIPVYQLAVSGQVERQLIFSGEVSLKLLAGNRDQIREAEIYLNIENLCPGIYGEDGPEARFKTLEAALGKAGAYPPACINMEYHLFTPEVLALFSRLGLKGSAWTVREEGEIRRLLAQPREIANVTTRNLAEALEIREEMAGW